VGAAPIYAIRMIGVRRTNG
jgi:hypothetical protein